jgi:hypothetical protein
MALAFWRFHVTRPLPTSAEEHKVWLNLIGYRMACTLVQVVSQQLVGGLQTVYEMSQYPYWSILTGLVFFVMGTSYWGRCYVFSAAFFGLAALMPLHLSWAALEFGTLWSLCLASFGLHLRRLGTRAESLSIFPPGGDT